MRSDGWALSGDGTVLWVRRRKSARSGRFRPGLKSRHSSGVHERQLAKTQKQTTRPVVPPLQPQSIQHQREHLCKNGRIDVVDGRLRFAPPEHDGRHTANNREIEKPETYPETPVLADPLQVASLAQQPSEAPLFIEPCQDGGTA